jgi:YbgC/YbaW family acyl-CoA thioester hydrolase
MTDRFPVRVYYEDTDLAGIVYYANYLKFIERGRTEFVRARGIDQAALREETGIVFAVRRVEADYLAPARFGDDLSVETEIEGSGTRASPCCSGSPATPRCCSRPASYWSRSPPTAVRRGCRRISAACSPEAACLSDNRWFHWPFVRGSSSFDGNEPP